VDGLTEVVPTGAGLLPTTAGAEVDVSKLMLESEVELLIARLAERAD
jgi:hypothetical protein